MKQVELRYRPILSKAVSTWLILLGTALVSISCSDDLNELEEPMAADNQTSEQEESQGQLQETAVEEETVQSEPTVAEFQDSEIHTPSHEQTIEEAISSLSQASTTTHTTPNSVAMQQPETISQVPSKPAEYRVGENEDHSLTKSNFDKHPQKNQTVPSRDGFGIYVVMAGDTLSTISQRIYGRVKYLKDIAEANNLSPPYGLFPGNELQFPLINESAKTFASEYKSQTKTITVKPGDTLAKISKQIYGTSSSWQALFAYNRDKLSDPHRIPVGITLSYYERSSGSSEMAKSKASPSTNRSSLSKTETNPSPSSTESAARKGSQKPNKPLAKFVDQEKPSPKKLSAKKDPSKSSKDKSKKDKVKVSPKDLSTP